MKSKICLLLLLLFSLFVGCNQNSTEPTGVEDNNTPPIETEYGTVKGTVYNVSTNSTISGVVVSCGGVTSTTTSDGKFQLNNIETGTRTLKAMKSDCETYSTSLNVLKGTKTKDIYMTAGTSTTSISGYVRDAETNQALTNVQITIAGMTDYTDASGHYQLPNVPQGQQTITAQKTDYDFFSGTVYIYSSDKQYDIQMTWKLPRITSSSIELTDLGVCTVGSTTPSHTALSGDFGGGGTTFTKNCRDYEVEASAYIKDAVGISKVELEYATASYGFSVTSLNYSGTLYDVLYIAVNFGTNFKKKTFSKTSANNYKLSFSFKNTVSGNLSRSWSFLKSAYSPKLIVTDTDGNTVKKTLSW